MISKPISASREIHFGSGKGEGAVQDDNQAVAPPLGLDYSRRASAMSVLMRINECESKSAGSAYRANIRGIYLNRDSLPDKIDLNHEPESAFFLNQHSDNPFKRTGCDFDAISQLQLRVGIHRNAGLEKTANCEDLLFGHRFGAPLVSDEANCAGNVQDSIPVLQGIHMVNENVTWKERQPNSFLPVLPPTQNFPHGQKHFYRAIAKFEKKLLLEPASCVERVPRGISLQIHMRIG
jgi:hypothetical protein